MKKVKSTVADNLRPEYKREDFGELVRGKYAARLKAPSNIVVLRPEVAKSAARRRPQRRKARLN